MKFRFSSLLTFLALALVAVSGQTQEQAAQWPTYGGDPGGQRYSAATQITKSNVDRLQVAWRFHTGALSDPKNAGRGGAFEATPILFKGSLYLASPFDKVFALDPATGTRSWSYDPLLDWTRELGVVTSRGVAAWSSSPSAPLAAGCADRIFLGTLDGRLMALDASNGNPCTGFGNHGVVDLTQNVDYRKGDDYAITSPPTVIGDVVVVGSGIADNTRVDVELGDVRAFDVRSGKLVWTWEPLPWAKGQTLRTGAGNTWSVIAADLEHGLIYLPTSSPSPDYYGGLRPGDDRDADSVVALDAKTGKKVWAFQVVHHNIWDYDVASEPLLFTFRGTIPAVAITTKMGMVFVLNRLTGQPLYPVTERPVPQSDVPGERSSPTQPFSDLPSLSPLALDMTKPLGATPEDDAACRRIISRFRYNGIYSPPSFQGTILFPSNVGGVNWGSAALDPVTGILYANTNRSPYIVMLRKRPLLTDLQTKRATILGLVLCVVLFWVLAWKSKGARGLCAAFVLTLIATGICFVDRHQIADRIRKSRSPWLDTGSVFAFHFGKEYGPNTGSPYAILRQPMEAAPGRPCSPLPWGTISAINLNTGQPVFQTPLGTSLEGQHTGTMNVGGPIVTAGGLVFTAASEEAFLRAFDAASGEEVWKGQLHAPAQATPMSYVLHGKQYIVVSAGGHSAFGTAQSDEVVAFTLP